MLGQLQDAGNTVTLAHYLELLDKANVLTVLQNYSGSRIRTCKSSPRFMVYDTSLMTYADSANRRRLLENATDRGRLVESAVGAYLLARGKEEGFQVYWWRERNNEVDFVIKKGSLLTDCEVKSGKAKGVGGSLVFKQLYPEALSLIIGKEHGRSSAGNSIERDILIPHDITLHALHYAIQRLYGWQNGHLHSFRLPNEVYKELTGNTVRGWGNLIGVLFQTVYPDDVWEARYGDDDYEYGSIKTWLRKKYTGSYKYLGLV